MDKNILDHMTFKEKQQTLSAIFNEYQLAKFQIEQGGYPYVPSHQIVIHENAGTYSFASEQKMINTIAKQNSYRQYVNYIDKALIRLTPTQRMILINDFIEQKDVHWWENYFSKSTYYRNKKEAMNRMLLLLLS